MKKIQIKKPDGKAVMHKIKSLKWSDIKKRYKDFQTRRMEKAEMRRNSAFGQKIQTAYAWMNRFSLILHGVWAILINYMIEAMSRHSVMAAWEYSRVSTKAFSASSVQQTGSPASS